MNFETRMFIYGTEAELRPVNAKDQIENIKNAKKYALENEGGDFAEKAAFLAGMIFSSAYDGDEKLFASFEDVLEKLTVEEISEIGNEIYTPVSLPEITAPDGTKEALDQREDNLVKNMDLTESVEDSEDRNFLRVINKADSVIAKLNEMGIVAEESSDGIALKKQNSFISNRKNGAEIYDMEEHEKAGLISEFIMNMDTKGGTKTSDIQPFSNYEMPEHTVYLQSGGAGKVRMQNISDFFERDSRRYDSSII